ncbi:coiled-coil domain-containing protein 81-like [Neopsephotus bourkii]|uniref:coiled-coil domain-containing protein 81-like n=1 Tax=Neopsephotus bourkii TaxID=309878 RepID=UPI002AA5249E|nr:coiled-coil domain-containing protein 81-like [Neopsephotus bourkii]
MTCLPLLFPEFSRIWASASSYLSQRLALHQDVYIPGLGTFAVVRQQVVSKKNLVSVVRPVFRLAKAIVQDHGLRYSHTDIPGHRHVEQLPCAQIASDNAVSESTVRHYIERTIRQFQVCLENKQNVTLVWRDVAMVIIQGKDVHTKFHMGFLQRLNGTAKVLEALLEVD